METTTTADEPLIDAVAAAKLMNVSRSLIYKWAELGWIPCVRLGSALRFRPAAVRAFIDRSERNGAKGNVEGRAGTR